MKKLILGLLIVLFLLQPVFAKGGSSIIFEGTVVRVENGFLGSYRYPYTIIFIKEQVKGYVISGCYNFEIKTKIKIMSDWYNGRCIFINGEELNENQTNKFFYALQVRKQNKKVSTPAKLTRQK